MKNSSLSTNTLNSGNEEIQWTELSLGSINVKQRRNVKQIRCISKAAKQKLSDPVDSPLRRTIISACFVRRSGKLLQKAEPAYGKVSTYR
jgi:hypothetical protein